MIWCGATLTCMAEEDEASRNGFCVEREILAAHDSLLVEVLRLLADDPLGHLPHELRQRRLVDGGRVRVILPLLSVGGEPNVVAVLELDLNRTSVCRDGRLRYRPHLLLDPREGRVRECAVSSSKRHLVGDDVVGVAGVHVGDANHPRVRRVQLARHNWLQRLHQCRGCHDGVRRLVRGGGVPAAAVHDRVEAARCGHQRRGVGADVAEREVVVPEAGGGVDAEDGARVPEGPLLEHAAPACAALLRRLEQQPHRALQRRLLRLEQTGGAEEHAGVRVVSARVHAPLVSALEVHLCQLVQRQRIEISAQRDNGAPLSNFCNHTGDGNRVCVVDAQPVERFPD
mmetsp:Transcript_26339/g.57179  ORF Transcript_26339/g.57179 Transcript_26339/m.57179 type:complete len:342 (-) Transcript_26339:363-1388(-)